MKRPLHDGVWWVVRKATNYVATVRGGRPLSWRGQLVAAARFPRRWQAEVVAGFVVNAEVIKCDLDAQGRIRCLDIQPSLPFQQVMSPQECADLFDDTRP